MIDSMRPMSAKAQRVVEWREHLATMDDEKFFSLIRMYLGEVKTPFNKQDLIEKLSAFLRKEENKKAIVTMLGERDIKIVSAVSMLGTPELTVLESFFGSSFAGGEFFYHLDNLEERLVLYRHRSRTNGADVISFVPLMEDSLSGVVSSSSILKSEKAVSTTEKETEPISDLLIASYISFLLAHRDAVKMDGSLKKHGAEEAEEIFSGQSTRITFLHTALMNLSLFKIENRHVIPDWNHIDQFASLPRLSQYLYLCASCSGKNFIYKIRDYAERLQMILNAVPKEGYTKGTLMLCDTLLSEKQGELPRHSARFSKILSRASEQTSLGYGSENESPMEKAIDAATEFGLLTPRGETSSGETVYATSVFFSSLYENESPKKSLSIDSAFSVTVLPGLTLRELIPFAKFADVVKADTAARFEINRKSVVRGFDSHLTTAEMISILSSASDFPIPQGLRVSLEEWQGSYSAISLFSGYVLQVPPSSAVLVTENPRLKDHVRQEIAPGCFLMDFSSDSYASYVMEKSGLEFSGKIKTAVPEPVTSDFYTVEPSRENVLSPMMKKTFPAQEKSGVSYVRDKDEQNKIILYLKSELEKISCTPEQRAALLDRIERRIIVTPEQLRPASVRFENAEAGAMDFQGKIHVVENAISNGSLLEVLEVESTVPIVGMPVSLDKKNDMTLLLAWKEGTVSKQKSIPLRRCARVRKVRHELRFD